jgi:hypothetical protein
VGAGVAALVSLAALELDFLSLLPQPATASAAQDTANRTFAFIDSSVWTA